MGTILERLPHGARVLIVRLRSLGDCVLTTPALELLKRSRPDLQVAVVVESRFAPVFEGNPDVDALLEPVAGEVADWRPQLCLNLHGGTRSLALALRSGARIRAGFGHYRCSFLYNLRIPRAQEILGVERKVHTAEHLASAMFYLGAPQQEIPPAKLFTSGQALGLPPYAVIHPKASGPEKTWPAERFLEVGTHLQKQWRLEPVFIAGAGEDLSPFRQYRTILGAPLGEVKSLLAGASLFLGNDSGPAHMAAAFRVPSTVIFGASDPEVWGPWRTPSQVLVARGDMAGIRTSEVLAALERLRVAA